MQSEPRKPRKSWDLARYFLALGATGFGGPVALVARMRRELVEERKSLSEADFRDGLALAQIAPGPLAAQLAIYVGWLADGTRGATLIGFAFVLPSLVIVLIVAELYGRSGGMPVIADLFYGVGAAVIAVIARSSVRLTRSTAKGDSLLWIVVVINVMMTIMLQRESVSLVFASGLLVMLARSGAYEIIAKRSSFTPLLVSPVLALSASTSL